LDSTLRELTYHPERFLDEAREKSTGNGSLPSLEFLVSEKQRWIATPQTRENAKDRCRSIRHINERLQSWLAEVRSDCQRRRDLAAAEARIEKILNWREYAFCLYPEETLREFFGNLLADI
jgi:hypothetical protein